MNKTEPTHAPPGHQADEDQPQIIDRRRLISRLGLLAAAAAASQTGPAASPAVGQSIGGSALASAETCSGAGTVWWSELVCPEPEKIRDFYAMVVGWQHNIVALNDPSRPPYIGEPDYTVFNMDGQESAGLVQTDVSEPAHARSGWLTYIQVANVDVSVRIAASKGGKVIKAPFEMAGIGRIAVIEDPQGAMVGLVTPVQNGSC